MRFTLPHLSKPLLLTWAALGAAALAGLWLVLAPSLRQLRLQQERLRVMQAKLASADTLLPQLPAQEQALTVARAEFAAAQEFLEPHQAIAKTLELLRAQADALHLELSATQAAVEGTASSWLHLASGLELNEVPLRLELRGRYRQIGEFLGRLRALPCVAVVRSIAMTTQTEQSASIEASVTLAVYVSTAEAAGS